MPTMPVQKSCTPLTRKRMHAIDGQPATGSPNSNVLTIMNTIRIIEIRKKSTPMTDASDSGATEKPVMPSIEYARSFRSGHFDVPAQRSSCSNSSHSV